MSAFRRFGIEHLSPSALNCWRETPGIWCLRYLARVREEGNAAIWRGNAVERGLELILRGHTLADAQADAMGVFEASAQGEISDNLDAERKRIPGMVSQACDWHADALKNKKIEPSALAATQLKVETRLDGVSIPVIGYVDFTFMEGPDTDCKSTKALPSAPRPDHVRQVALYWQSRQRRQRLLYVTEKKHAAYEPKERDMADAIAELTDAARSLERFLSIMPSVDDAIRCMPMPADHYAFGPAYKAKLNQLQEAF